MDIIKYILSFIVVILVVAFFTTFVAVRIRYLFFKLIGRKKSIKYLDGESENGQENNGTHGCFNFVIGWIAFFVFALLIVYIFNFFAM